MKLRQSRQIIRTIAVVALLVSGGAAPASSGAWDWATGPALADKDGEGRDWRLEVIPYLWLASLDGEIGMPPVGTIPVTASFSTLASNLNAAFAGLLDVRYRRWHLISDNSWVSLKIQAVPDTPAITAAEVDPSIAFGTVAAAYELPLDLGLAWDVYLGARWWHVTVDVKAIGPFGFGAGGITKTWADAVVGTRLRYWINDSWRVMLQGDIGAGDASLDWSVLGGLTYMFNDHVGATAAYRVLGVDYRSNLFLYDVRQNGLLLGLNIAY